jgi:hypothetical protein
MLSGARQEGRHNRNWMSVCPIDSLYGRRFKSLEWRAIRLRELTFPLDSGDRELTRRCELVASEVKVLTAALRDARTHPRVHV